MRSLSQDTTGTTERSVSYTHLDVYKRQLLFCGVLVFHLVTLPLEFDASARALKLLSETNTLSGSELGGAKSVLDAAALTYVAALVMTVLQLVRLLALRNMRRD